MTKIQLPQYVYLRKGSSVYQFRMAIPKELQGHDELPSGAHIQKSLQSTDRREAGMLALEEAQKWKLKFERLRLPVQVEGLPSLWEAAEYTLAHGHRAELEIFMSEYIEPVVELTEGWLKADYFPALEEMNDSLKRLLPGVQLSMNCNDEPTVKEQREGLISLLESCWEVVAKINAQLSQSVKHLKLVNIPSSQITPKHERETPKTVLEVFSELTQSSEQRQTTVDQHHATIERYLNLMGLGWKDEASKALSKENLLKYKELSIESGIAPQTITNRFQPLFMLTRYMHLHGYSHLDTGAGIKLPKKTTKQKQEKDKLAYTEKELVAVVDLLDKAIEGEQVGGKADYRTRLSALLIKTLVFTGCRSREIAQLHGTDVDLKNGLLTVTDLGEEQSVKKTASLRTIPIHKELLEDKAWVDAVKEAQKENSRVFTSHLTGDLSKASYHWFTKRVRAPLVEQGAITKERAERLDRHSFRRAHATLMSKAGVEARIIELIQGRTRKDVSSIGAHYDKNDFLPEMQAAIDKVVIR